MAAEEGYIDVVKYLVAVKQTDIHIKAYNGVCTEWEYMYILVRLFSWFAFELSLFPLTQWRVCRYFYGFIKSIYYTNLPILEYEYCFISHDQRIALHVAVEGGHVDIVQFLVNRTPDDIKRKDDDGVSIVLS